MPIVPPLLDDRSFDDLVEELLARIPAHTPEWTHPRESDPGRTILELFAWLADTILYRANLIPERQRLAFLRLLGAPLRPAVAARGLLSLSLGDQTSAVSIRPHAMCKAPVPVETEAEITVLPVTSEAYYKRPLTSDEMDNLHDVLPGLRQIYQLDKDPRPYVTTPVFVDGSAVPDGFDLIGSTVDQCLWLALLAPKGPASVQAEIKEAARKALGGSANGGQQLLSVGVVPAVELPALFEQIGPRAKVAHDWEISTVTAGGEPDYLTLQVLPGSDTTNGLSKSGTLRLLLPATDHIRAPSNDVREDFDAGVGDRPPRLDDPAKAGRLVAWLRLRPTEKLERLALSWVGVNAVEVEQVQTISGRVAGVSDGTADQTIQLPGVSVDRTTLKIQVEEEGRGYQQWQCVDDLAIGGPRGHEARIFALDSEAGVIRFGDGAQGRIPEAGRRVRIEEMRAGGGRAGNLPAGTLKDVTAQDLAGAPVAGIKALQPLALSGGDDAETLDRAEKRIPALFRHKDRAVTEGDYHRIAEETPGVDVGRVEVLPRFKPQQRRSDVPGVVSVMVLPWKPLGGPPNPRPDRPFIERVHGYLDERRPLGTELYVIGCEYLPLAISVGIAIRDGFGRDQVLHAVQEALRRFLWPLRPGGPQGEGWPLGVSVRDREIEAEVARVAGVGAVNGVNLFEQREASWQLLPRRDHCDPQELVLTRWQLPELLAVTVTHGDPGLPKAPPARETIAVPVVPEVC